MQAIKDRRNQEKRERELRRGRERELDVCINVQCIESIGNEKQWKGGNSKGAEKVRSFK